MVNLSEIIKRAKIFKGLGADKELAAIIGLSGPDFSKRKKSGTLLPLLIDWGIAERVNLNWLLTGEGGHNIKGGGGIDKAAAVDEDPEVVELLTMTSEIIKSDTEYAFSLSANIRSFHRAMNLEKKVQDHDKRIAQIEDRTNAASRIRKEDPPEQKEDFIKKRAM